MQALLNNLPQVVAIKNFLKCTTSSEHFKHVNIENIPIYNDTISVVMTSSNRSKQVYYTLKTLTKSIHKHVQIILVDDSTIDPVSEEILRIFPFHIDFITINRNNKMWLNPVVNYNLGFNFVKGSKVIIQNAEVCHVGDVLHCVNEHVVDKYYYAFDVRSSKGFDENEIIYLHEELKTSIYKQDALFASWYCHHVHNNSRLHFLTACTTKTLQEFNGFSLDYSFSADYDDNDLLLRIQNKGIFITNVPHEQFQCGGIHLYHKLAHHAWTNLTSNKEIYDFKLFKFRNDNLYIEFLEGDTIEEFIKNIMTVFNKNTSA